MTIFTLPTICWCSWQMWTRFPVQPQLNLSRLAKFRFRSIYNFRTTSTVSSSQRLQIAGGRKSRNGPMQERRRATRMEKLLKESLLLPVGIAGKYHGSKKISTKASLAFVSKLFPSSLLKCFLPHILIVFAKGQTISASCH